MQIAIISDSHRDISAMKLSLNKINKADLLFHLGDNVVDIDFYKENFRGEIINISGNCDFNVMEPSEKIVRIEGLKFFITHGHRYNVKRNIFNLQYRAEEVGAKIVLYGHTHIPSIEYEGGIWYINPGSISLSRLKKNTLAMIDITDNRAMPYIVEIE